MGQFLAIGIITNHSVIKAELNKYKISTEDLILKMETDLYFKPEIYSITETESSILFELKAEIIKIELVSFLEKLYPQLYPSRKHIEYADTLALLKNKNIAEWFKLAKDKSSEEFQWDDYGEKDRLYFDMDFQPKIDVQKKAIILSIEGKIIMETYGRQFNFFKYGMQEAFASFKLAGALGVYITG